MNGDLIPESLRPFVLVAAVVGGSIWSGYVIATLWAWFLVPVFPVPALTLSQAFGLSLLMHALTARFIPNETPTNWLARIEFLFSAPLAYLVCGWVVRCLQ